MAAPAFEQRESFLERHALAAIRAHGVLGDARESGRILGTRHDRPAVRLRGRYFEHRAWHAHALADYVEHRLGWSQPSHFVPGAPSQRDIQVGPQSSPISFGHCHGSRFAFTEKVSSLGSMLPAVPVAAERLERAE